MKKTELLFNLASVPVDAIMLFLAGLAAFYSRIYSVDIVGPVLYQLQVSAFLATSIRVVPVIVLLFAAFGLYNLRASRLFLAEFSSICIAVTTGLSVAIFMYFFNRDIFVSRFIVLSSWVYAVLFVSLGRLLLYVFQQYLLGKGRGLHKVIVVYGDARSMELLPGSMNNKTSGYVIVDKVKFGEGILDYLEAKFRAREIDDIIQTDSGLAHEAITQLIEFARSHGLAYSYIPNLFDSNLNVVELSFVDKIPFVRLKNTPLDGWGQVFKRLLDIVLSVVCITLLIPVYIVVFFAIKFDSKGPAIFSALRAGKGRDFMFYKFRSMYTHMSTGKDFGGEEAERLRKELWQRNNRGGEDGPFLKIKNDPRVTRVGRMLRKTKLDEIPQFWNVLKGDMSMVGPRAHVLDEVEKYKARYQRMFSIKPGIFGLSQLAQSNTPELPFEDEIRLNTKYIENWSAWYDLKILWLSFYTLVFRRSSDDDY